MECWFLQFAINNNLSLNNCNLISAEILKDKGHSVPVVAVQPLLNSEEESEYSDRTELSPSQICSLDEGGTVIIWTVIQSHSAGGMATQDLGLAHWGRVRLVSSSTFSLTELASL
ncbi:hypothetical protein L9F63_020122 [Diploptera punctata]|uniref:Uncharacterized protein n=1 Tax=Diploptera punctata TaxID=6984 RepID=A0AAD8EDE8_DIPPU|nr:hypothetical protein L9F63_020122 [Diploptera punctata]